MLLAWRHHLFVPGRETFLENDIGYTHRLCGPLVAGPRRFAARYYEHFPPFHLYSVNTGNCCIFRRIFRTAIHINERMFGLKRIGILSQLHYLQSKSEHRSFVIFRRNTDEQYAMAMICSKMRILTQMFQ